VTPRPAWLAGRPGRCFARGSIHCCRATRQGSQRRDRRLIQFLDKTDNYLSRELEDDGDREAVGDDEPSLGSFDRMMNQEKSYRQTFGEADIDGEQHDADREDDDPDEAKQQPPEMGGVL
jgi:hypothetical protein